MIKNDSFEIQQNERNLNIFSIKFFKHSKTLINSITKTKLLLGTSIYDNYNSILFKATSVKTFKQFQEYLKTKNGNTILPYNELLKMIHDLTNQLKYMIECENMCFIGYNPENIIVFDNNKFAYISSEHLFNIDINNNCITISYPFTKNDFFMSPEVTSIKELPYNINYKTSYYSLGCLIMYCTISFENRVEEIIHNLFIEQSDYFKQSSYFEYTKLYGLLRRCLNKNPFNRSIIYF